MRMIEESALQVAVLVASKLLHIIDGGLPAMSCPSVIADFRKVNPLWPVVHDKDEYLFNGCGKRLRPMKWDPPKKIQE